MDIIFSGLNRGSPISAMPVSPHVCKTPHGAPVSHARRHAHPPGKRPSPADGPPAFVLLLLLLFLLLFVLFVLHVLLVLPLHGPAAAPPGPAHQTAGQATKGSS